MSRLPESARRGPEFFGMHISKSPANGGVWEYGTLVTCPLHPEIGYGARRIWDTFTSWKLLAPNAARTYNWTRMDAVVAETEALGQDMIYCLGGGTPNWAAGTAVSPGTQYNPAPPTSTTDWENWCTDFATRYAGRIKYYEIWNEPNLVTGFSGTEGQLLALGTAAYPAIKAADPAAIVLSPCVTGFDGLYYLERYLKAGGAAYTDAISFHPYVFPNQPIGIIDMVQLAKQMAVAHGLGDAPLICSEFGWINYYTSAGVLVTAEEDIPMPTAQGAAYVSQMMICAWIGGAAEAYYYCLDGSPLMKTQMVNYPTETATLLPPALAYQYLASLLSGGKLGNYRQRGLTHLAEFETSAGRTGRVYWCGDWETETIDITGAVEIRDVLGATVTLDDTLAVTMSPQFVFYS